MLESSRKKIFGTKYSLSSRIRSDGEMEILLYFGGKRDSSIELDQVGETRKKLEELLHDKSYLDIDRVLERFTPYLKRELNRLIRRKEDQQSSQSTTELLKSDISLSRVDAIEEKLEDLAGHLASIEITLEEYGRRLTGIESMLLHSDELSETPSESTEIIPTTILETDSRNIIWTNREFFERIERLKTQGKKEEYINTLEEMREEDPANIIVLNMLGNAYLKTEDYIQSKAYFEEVLRNEEENFNALIGLAMVFHHTQRSQRSLEFLERAEKLMPESIKLHRLFTTVYDVLGDLEKSKHYQDKAERAKKLFDFSSTKDEPESQIEQAENLESVSSLIENAKPESKTFDITDEISISEKPENVKKYYEEYIERGKHYYQARKLELALKMFTEAAKLNSTLQAWHNIGVVSESLGDRESAFVAFSKALSICEKEADEEGIAKYKKWLSTL